MSRNIADGGNECIIEVSPHQPAKVLPMPPAPEIDTGPPLPQDLISRLEKIGFHVDIDFAAKIGERLSAAAPVTPDYLDSFLLRVQERLDRGLRTRKPITKALLPILADEAAESWAAEEGRRRGTRIRAAQAQDARDRMFAEEVLRSPEADDEQKRWARGVLGQEE